MAFLESCYCPSSGDNSFFWAFDIEDGNTRTDNWDLKRGTEWVWQRLNSRSGPFEGTPDVQNGDDPIPIKLAAGEHTLHLILREDGAHIDQFFATTDKAFDPNENDPQDAVDAQAELGTPGPKLERPWVWMIVPTGDIGGAAAAESGIDYIRRASEGAITETEMAQQGAIYQSAVGEKFWTLSQLSSIGGNNITEMVIDSGLGSSKVNNHVAYGSLRLKSPHGQQTMMYVGEDDAVKV